MVYRLSGRGECGWDLKKLSIFCGESFQTMLWHILYICKRGRAVKAQLLHSSSDFDIMDGTEDKGGKADAN